jgi:hypothetical protein
MQRFSTQDKEFKAFMTWKHIFRANASMTTRLEKYRTIA